jgi:predicted lipoprotein with Yx(FWY)xxD motif
MKKALTFLAAMLVSLSSLAVPAADRDGLLADAKGMTLYTFKKDARLKSTCYDGCAKAWPPYLVSDGSEAGGDFSVVPRKDGSRQWAYKGRPLYYYGGDAEPGESGGEGSGKTWYVIRLGKNPGSSY